MRLSQKSPSLRRRLKSLKEQVNDLTVKNGQAAGESLRLQAQLTNEAAKKPDLPVSVSFRKARAAQGYVAVIDTTVKAPIAVLLTHKSASLGTRKQMEVHLDPGAPYELGGLDGFVFEPGDSVTLENNNYSSASVSVAP